MKDTMIILQEKAKWKRSSYRRQIVKALWITIAVFGSLIIGGAMLMASTESYNWLLKQ
jgi:hypothetical protein